MAEPNFFRSFDGMCWPAKSERLGDIAWCLTYSENLRMEDRLCAASALTAYHELITMSAKRRNAIIRELRKGPGIIRSAEGEGA